ncbi:MAG: chemotaxis protein CheD [Spirochaetes bacterium]|nr:chemotaxis protein CheD [Spirochaetota bacterium]
MDFKLINVGIADIGISAAPDILRTILGSCVGICLYDPGARMGGMSHIMLPSIKAKSTSQSKYADTAIPLLIEKLLEFGARKERMVAKLTGGATMFNVSESSIMGEIGKNNIAKVREVLREQTIEVVAEDVGGDYGRTIDFYLETGEVRIKSIGREIRVI